MARLSARDGRRRHVRHRRRRGHRRRRFLRLGNRRRDAGPAPGPAAADPAPGAASTQAVKLNAALPLASGPNPAARPFKFKGDKAARARALECLTSAIYYEAGQRERRRPARGRPGGAQPRPPCRLPGQRLRRRLRGLDARHRLPVHLHLRRLALPRQPKPPAGAAPTRSPKRRFPAAVYAPVGNATHYHADYVVPYWARRLAKNAVVGAHIFYRWAGGWGQPGAFTKAYAGREPNVDALRSAALAAEAATANQAQPGTSPRRSAEIPGAEAIKLEPSMRGDKRVAVRFNLAARKASDKAEHKPICREGRGFGQPPLVAVRRRCGVRLKSRSAQPGTPRRGGGAARSLPPSASRRQALALGAEARSRRQRQLDPQPDLVEPAVDRQIVVRQQRRSAHLAARSPPAR